MAKTSKDEHLYGLFAEAFHDVAEPHLREMRDALNSIDTRLDKVEEKINRD
jgi:hypothetical protein